jgi:hypothetical protein
MNANTTGDHGNHRWIDGESVDACNEPLVNAVSAATTAKM